jgi:UDP-N-acetylmuramate dehydrogenase
MEPCLRDRVDKVLVGNLLILRLFCGMIGYMDKEFQELKNKLPGVRKDVALAQYTTFKIGGSARYFFVAKTSGDIQKAVRVARKLGIRYFLLSGGSNVLISDNGFDGLIIKIRNTKYQILNTKVVAESGVPMSTLVKETTKRGLQGLEWAGGLPGTVGGAVRGNAGAFGGETKDNIFSVVALDESGNKNIFSNKECKFGYRNSVFKQKGLVVLSCAFALQKGNKTELQAIVKEHSTYRKTKHPLEYPNAGSIFKNCNVADVPKKVAKEFADVIKQDPFPVIPTAAIVSKAKIQGLQVGAAQVSQKHPNYIVNKDNASAQDVLQLIEKVKQKIKTKYNITLEEEIQFVS